MIRFPSLESPLELSSYICGKAFTTERKLEVFYPYDGSLTGTVTVVGPEQLELAIATALRESMPLSRYRRHEILDKAKDLLAGRAEEFAHLNRLESGLCMRETRYEILNVPHGP